MKLDNKTPYRKTFENPLDHFFDTRAPKYTPITVQNTPNPSLTNMNNTTPTGSSSDTIKKVHAYEFLDKAVNEMKDRAAQRDTTKPDGSGGERSMAATVKAFNALTGKTLTEAEGWEFMILLKLVRGRQGSFRADDYTDAAAYAGLLGECESTSR